MTKFMNKSNMSNFDYMVLRKEKATFERLYTAHKIYPYTTMIFSRDFTDGITVEFIDELREKEGV